MWYYVIMESMTNHIREEVRVLLVRKHMSQKELARRAGVSRSHLSEMLAGRRGHIPPGWEHVLEALGLELTIRPKAEEAQ